MSRTAVVTGGGSGLGQSISAKLAADGHRVAVLDVNLEAAEKVAAEIQAVGGTAVAVGVDVSDEAAVESAFATVRELAGASRDPRDERRDRRLHSVRQDHPRGVEPLPGGESHRHVSRACGRHCRTWWPPSGAASSPSRRPPVSRALRQGHYSATKGGVIAMTKTVALDYAAQGHHRQHRAAVRHRLTDASCNSRPRESCRRPSISRRPSRLAGSAWAKTWPRCVRFCAPRQRATSTDR